MFQKWLKNTRKSKDSVSGWEWVGITVNMALLATIGVIILMSFWM